MTDKQYKNLNAGDVVTRINGPNKNVLLKVDRKYLASDGTKCLSCSGILPNTVYNQNKCFRNSNRTWGTKNCFKIVMLKGD